MKRYPARVASEVSENDLRSSKRTKRVRFFEAEGKL
jgi:hypothetical protein